MAPIEKPTVFDESSLVMQHDEEDKTLNPDDILNTFNEPSIDNLCSDYIVGRLEEKSEGSHQQTESITLPEPPEPSSLDIDRSKEWMAFEYSSYSSSSLQSLSSSGSKRSLVSKTWNERFQELIEFRETYDHCFVPHSFPQNPKLSQWVRKQRHQRKRKDKGLHSTLTSEREEMLTNAGFIWDSHRAQWQERYQSLELFRLTNGHCNVPSNFPDTSLSNWVKNQRKQFKLLKSGFSTSMDQERIGLLNSLGFDWNPRNLKKCR